MLHSLVIDFVPNSGVKTILTQPNTDGKRGRWIARILEFDLDIRPTKLVKEVLEEKNTQEPSHVPEEKNP